MTILLRWLGRLSLLVLAGMVLYGLAGVCFALLPMHRQYVQPEQGVTLYITSNGKHTDIVMPLHDTSYHWWQVLDTTRFVAFRHYPHLAVGWGDQGFYEASRAEGAMTPGVVLAALFWPTPSLLHLDFYRHPPQAGHHVVAFRVSPAQYKRIAAHILATLPVGQRRIGADAVAGYGCEDFFVPARGSYHCLRTCNQWTAEALQHAGVTTSYWAPFPSNVLLPLRGQLARPESSL